MGNTLLTTSKITRAAVRLFVNSNSFIQNINRQYDDQFGRAGEKIGSQLRIRLPNDYTVTNGPGASVQDTAEVQTVLTMATQQHVDVAFTSADLFLSIEDFSEIFLAPMMNNLGGAVATGIIGGSEGGICNIVYNADASNNILSPNATTFLTAGATLDDNSTPMVGTNGGRKIINSPWTEARTVASLSGLFNPAQAISTQYKNAKMYDALGFLWYKDQTVITHTTGSFSAGLVSGANQTGTSITSTAITGTLNQGDIITLTGVNAVNRVTKQTTGKLRQFVVTANVASGATTIPVYPAVIPASGGNAVQYQTVTVSPADQAPILLVTNASSVYRKNFAYAPDAITMATGDLPLPGGVVRTGRENFDGVSMRLVTQYAIGTDQEITRMDVLYGSLYVRPEWACVVADVV